MIERIANIFKFFGVFDGHGQYGKNVAESCSAYFKSIYFSILKDCLKSYEE